jgi:hypothetical protein
LSASTGREVANAVVTIADCPDDDAHLTALASILHEADREALIDAVFRLAAGVRGLAVILAEIKRTDPSAVLKHITG